MPLAADGPEHHDIASGATICLATVTTTDGFVPGTVAMIGSFLRCHPSFDGDVVVIERLLNADSKEVLKAVFPRVKFLTVGSSLLQAAERLRAELPTLRVDDSLLACLEAFGLAGYRKVLFCDCDLLFRAPVDELLRTDETLICCGDRVAAKGWQLDAETYRAVDPSTNGAGRPTLRDPFNSGMMLIDGEICGERTYGELLALMEGEQWRGLIRGYSLSDQAILNRYFAGRQTLVSWTYNYLLPEAAEIQAREGLAAGDAKVLHFKGSTKPWLPARSAQRWIGSGGEEYMASAFNHWYDSYMDTLVAAALRNSRFERPDSGTDSRA